MGKQNDNQTNPKEVYHPDDRFFRKVMSEKENARAHLETFYQEIAEMADLDTLEQETDEFIKSNLKIFRSDIIYRCRLKNKEEHFYFSLIWEHKSQPEEEVAIQVGLYIFEFLYKLSKAKDRKIEPILPLIFYNGKEDWIPKTMHELFENHPNFDFFQRFLPNFDFLFKNITKEPIENLLAIELSFFRSAMMSMAFRHKADLIFQYISTIFDVTESDQKITVGTYILGIIERSPQDLMETFKNIDFENKPNFMSTLAMLKAEGKAEGILQGKAILSLEMLLKTIANFPKFSAKQMALLVPYKELQIKRFLTVLKSKELKKIKTFIQKEFLKTVKLNKKEQAQINKLLKMITGKN